MLQFVHGPGGTIVPHHQYYGGPPVTAMYPSADRCDQAYATELTFTLLLLTTFLVQA